MKNEIFIARLAKGAMASTMLGSFLAPQDYSVVAEAPRTPIQSVNAGLVPKTDNISFQHHSERVQFSFQRDIIEWTEEMEKEFRSLALAEAKGTLTAQNATRLEELSLLRDRLRSPRSEEEILLQLKRDRILEKIAETLRQYVEFQESADIERATA